MHIELKIYEHNKWNSRPVNCTDRVKWQLTTRIKSSAAWMRAGGTQTTGVENTGMDKLQEQKTW